MQARSVRHAVSEVCAGTKAQTGHRRRPPGGAARLTCMQAMQVAAWIQLSEYTLTNLLIGDRQLNSSALLYILGSLVDPTINEGHAFWDTKVF